MPKRTRKIDSYDHSKEQRPNNPEAGLVNPDTDPDPGDKTPYQHDVHIDPELAWDDGALRRKIDDIVADALNAGSLEQVQNAIKELPGRYGTAFLDWAGRAERSSFEVPLVSLHRHERIDSRSILAAVRKGGGGGGESADEQLSLFDAERETPLRQAVEFYRHRDNWSNRLIAGDSLQVMNSLLQKEGMAGKVQCIYMDPPYGVKFGSNFQAFVSKKEVRDGRAEDIPHEPEMLKAFRDTWELGIHSYLTYMRDRLLLARELLADSGSVFVQIGDENVHRVGMVMDEIFGAENRVTTITYASTGGSSSKTLPDVSNYLLWYAKDKEKVKFRQLYAPLNRREIVDLFTSYAMVELENGECRKLTKDEKLDPGKTSPQKGAALSANGLELHRTFLNRSIGILFLEWQGVSLPSQ